MQVRGERNPQVPSHTGEDDGRFGIPGAGGISHISRVEVPVAGELLTQEGRGSAASGFQGITADSRPGGNSG